MSTETHNGSFEDMISFFGISPREGRRWTATGQAEITFWRCGRKLLFGEDAIVEKFAKCLVAERRMAPGEARELARAQWRQHLQARPLARQPAFGSEIQQLRARVERIERLLNLEPKTEVAA